MRNVFQRKFFERLSRQFTSRAAFVAAVGEALFVGRDGVYRRLRGETPLTVEELLTLSETFGISTGIGRFERSTATRAEGLRYPSRAGAITNEYEYVDFLDNQLEHMLQLPEVSFDFATPELPIYYEYFSPLLCAFKIFMYGITTWNMEKWRDLKFSPALLDPDLHRRLRKAIRRQYTMPARELWSIGILDVTLRQIMYLVEIDRFDDPQDANRLLDELLLIIDHLERMVRADKRFYPLDDPTDEMPDFRCYHNELSNTNNVILVNSNSSTYIFTTLVTPNYIATDEPSLHQVGQQWFDRLVALGNPLHSSGSKYSARYFAGLRRQVHNSREALKLG